MQSYNHFTLFERENLQELLKEGKSQRQIAKELNRSPSSVSREIKRNTSSRGKYQHWYATCLYIHRRKKCIRKPRIAEGTDLYNYVYDALKKYWPPETITMTWKLAHSGHKLSWCTIYKMIQKKAFPGIHEKTHTRRHGKLKHYKRSTNYTSVKAEHNISQRPEEANLRLRVGDFEGDTVLGGIGKGLLACLTDRKSRFYMAAIVKNKTTAAVTEAMIDLLKAHSVHSITLDNGSEFADYKAVEKALGITIYFADPHAPWQRGTNENLNDSIRFFFPKGCDFTKVSQEQLDVVLTLLNNRPRKCLGWLSPAEVFFSKCCT